MNERPTALRGLLCRVQEIADTVEDKTEIRHLISEAGIKPNTYVGIPHTEFTDDMTVEWLLGQWADAIDQDFPYLAILRTFSGHTAKELCGYTEARR